jgi:hypothetical protein
MASIGPCAASCLGNRPESCALVDFGQHKPSSNWSFKADFAGLSPPAITWRTKKRQKLAPGRCAGGK